MDDREVAAAAFMTGSFAGILAPGAIVSCDGEIVRGSPACAVFLARTVARLDPDSVDRESVNGEPGMALRRAGRVVAIVIPRSVNERIVQVWLVTAPEKLASWN